MSVKNPQTKLVMKTHRAPGEKVTSKTSGEPVRAQIPDDINTMKVKHYDQFYDGCPRPFRPVFKFDSDSTKDVFGRTGLPKPVTGRR